MNRTVAAMVAVAIAGCSFPRPADVMVDANEHDDGTDGVDVVSFGSYVKIEFGTADVPTEPLTWSSDIDINTDTSSMCNVRHNKVTDYCVVAATDIALGEGATLHAHGSKPIVLLATGEINLQGTVDVSSKHDGSPRGAGADAVVCEGTPPTAHSGGFGGSFHGKGGAGSTPEVANGETGGVAAPPVSLPAVLRGGCRGGDGGKNNSVPGGPGGSSGGAIALIASSLRMGGKINASGAGGRGGPAGVDSLGGGGGGSGGMIVVDVPSIAPTGPNIWLLADGGGGGQGGMGGTGTGSGAGDDGGEEIDPFRSAQGGRNALCNGGPGGDGSLAHHFNGSSGLIAVGGGGGGGGAGGAGFILSPPITGATLSPLPLDQ